MKTKSSTWSSRSFAIARHVLVGAASLVALQAAHAGPGSTPSTDLLGLPKQMPVYYANSPSGTHTVIDPATGAMNAASNSGTLMRKFVDPLPNVNAANPTCGATMVTNAQAIGAVAKPTGNCIPLAVPDTTTYPGSDYYVIGVVEYAQQMHSDLPKATALRGYTQLNGPLGATTATLPDPLNPLQTYTTYTAWPQPFYLGPVIIATRERPVRVKYVNLLPTGRATFSTNPSCEVVTVAGTTAATNTTTLSYTNGSIATWGGGYSSPGSDLYAGIPETVPATIPPTYVAGRYAFCETIANAPVATARNGDLMIPNDLSIRGAGAGQNQGGTASCTGYAANTLPGVMQAADPKYAGVCLHTLNRAEVHLHGGMNPWISDGTPHQWTVPAAEFDPAVTALGRVGESYRNVPDMADPGPGAGTLFWTNQQSARLMFYHDHTSGLTRTNVYVGEAAGYVLRDTIEATLESGGTIAANGAAGLAAVTVPAGTIPTVGIPLVIEDKTFVPLDIAAQDPLWSTTWWGAPGDLWYPHVYETNQDPTSITGSNNAGRWDYGQWFFPPMNPATLRGPIPQPSLAPEGFMDTPVINGTAYPVLHVSAGLTRFRILSVPNERTNNLSWFVADSTLAPVAPAVANTEVKMVPAVPALALPVAPVAGTVYACPATGNNIDSTLFGGQPMAVLDSTGYPLNGTGLPRQGMTYVANASANGMNHTLTATGIDGGPCWPASWPTDGRDGGVPDVTNAGPAWIHIGTEGGFLPQPLIIPPTPLGYEYNRRSVSVLNSYYHGLYLGPAERADVLVDFSKFAGKTLLLYNDAPAPNPGFDARNDYYTGDVDQTANGGAQPTLAGYGPNTRTILQVVVDGVGAPLGSTATAITGAQITALSTTILPAAFAASQPAPIIGEPGFSPAFPTAAKAVSAATATNTVGGILPAGVATGATTTFTLASSLTPVPNVGETVTTAGFSTAGLNGTFTVSAVTAPVGTTAGSFTVPLASTGFAVSTTNGTATYVNPAIAGGAFPQQYGKIGDHTVTFKAGTLSATSAVQTLTAYESASATVGQPAGDLLLGSAAIHEIFDTDYGRMNSVEGYEMPATNFLTQTTVPLAYVDATSDMFKEGETQIWKVTHNGVDTHAIHFHLLNLQVLNRVGWDGTIRPPDPDEVGWKETIKMNPLEDIFLAFQAVKPELPFNLPDSSRRLDPTTPTVGVAGQANFTNPPGGEFPWIPALNCNNNIQGLANTTNCTNLDGLKAPAAGTEQNRVANFGWEYVWHCHLLGHEENDMMRPLVMSVNSTVPAPASAPAASPQPAVAPTVTTAAVLPGMAVSWTDATPIVYAATTSTAVWPYLSVLTAGPGSLPLSATNLGNAANEIGFHIYSASSPTAAATPTSLTGMTLIGTAPANSGNAALAAGTAGAAFIDTTATQNIYYAYAVTAFNQAGESAPVFTAFTLQTQTLSAPPAVTTLVATPNAPGVATSVTLTWTASAGTTANAILRCSTAAGVAACVPATALATAGAVATYLDGSALPNTQYCYTLNPSNAVGATTTGNNVACATTPALPSAAPATVTATFTPMPTNTLAATPFAMTVNWAASTGASGYVVQACTVGCNSAGAGTWANTATQPVATAVTIGNSQAQGALVMYRVATLSTLSSCVGTTCTSSTFTSGYAYSAAVQLAVMPIASAAPTATPSTTGAPTVALAWTNPVQAANAAVANVIVNRAVPPTGVAGVIATLAAGTAAYSDTTVLAGTSYGYSITEQNAAGQATSAPTTVVTTAIVIPAPTNLATRVVNPPAVNPAYNSVQLQWTNNATTQTGFPVYRAFAVAGACPAFSPSTTTTTASGGWQFLNTASGVGFGGGATVRYTDATVGPATQYCYVVQAINGTAYSLPSNVLPATTPAITLSAPTTPTVAVAAGTTAGAGPTVTVGWSWTRGAGATASRFDILRFNGTTYVTVGTVLGCGGGGGGCTRSFTDTTPVQGSVTSYQIMAVNVTGGVQTFSAPLTTANVTIPTLPITVALGGTTPTCVVGPPGTLPCRVGFGGRTITLTWPSLATTGATAVAVQRSTTANNFAPGTTTTTNVALTSTGLVVNLGGGSRGTSYNFRLRFTNAAGFVYDGTFTIVASP